MINAVLPRRFNNVPFAQVQNGCLFWPVLSTDPHGREVSYIGVDGVLRGTYSRQFGAGRISKNGRARWHCGVDLFARPGDVVVAPASGRIIKVSWFYDTVWCVLFQTDAGIVINFGEVADKSWEEWGLGVGSLVEAGDPLARVGRLSSGNSMLHFEVYASGTTVTSSWTKDEPAPSQLLDPSLLLLFLQENDATVLPPPYLKIGDHGDSVRDAQTLLKDAHGFDIATDGVFGQATESAVRAFQRQHRIDVDGEIGDDTWALLRGAATVEPTQDLADAHKSSEWLEWIDMHAFMANQIDEYEGLFQDDPDDPGNYTADGRLVGTMRGVTPAVLARHRGIPVSSVTRETMLTVNAVEAAEIAMVLFFEGTGLSKLKPYTPFLAHILDFCWGSGPRKGIEELQAQSGVPSADVDGLVGPQTIGIYKAYAESNASAVRGFEITRDGVARRILYHESIAVGEKAKYLLGWNRRAAGVLEYWYPEGSPDVARAVAQTASTAPLLAPVQQPPTSTQTPTSGAPARGADGKVPRRRGFLWGVFD